MIGGVQNSYNLRSKSKTTSESHKDTSESHKDTPKNDNTPNNNETNVQDLFDKFNARYFWGRLTAVKLEFSKRMKSSAGLCRYRPKENLCFIRLSSPLLSLRPQSDLVDTLLHEMIHAYLFVTKTHDVGSHGPEFHKHMDRINKKAGTNISVYHTFHSEVKMYQQHWWRCNGPCVNWAPTFGLVKRSANKPPGPSDIWWQNHILHCGGQYIKIKEPIEYTQRRFKGLFGSELETIMNINRNLSNFEVTLQNYRRRNITSYIDLTSRSRNIGNITAYVDLTTNRPIYNIPSGSSQPCPICSLNISSELSAHVTKCLKTSGIVNMLNEPMKPLETFCVSNKPSEYNNIQPNNYLTKNSGSCVTTVCPICNIKVTDVKLHLEDGCLKNSGILDDLDYPFDLKDCKSSEEPSTLNESDSSFEIVCVSNYNNIQPIDSHTEDLEIDSKQMCPICNIQAITDMKSHLEGGCLNDSGILDDLDFPFDLKDCESAKECSNAIATKTSALQSSLSSQQTVDFPLMSTVCPICSLEVKGDLKNHINECLSNSGLFNDCDQE